VKEANVAERRLLEDGANEFEARILASGLRDGPSAMNRRRIIAGLGVALPTTLAASVAAGPLGWIERARQLAWSKWSLGGAISAISVYTGVKLVEPDAPPPAPAPATLAAVQAPERPDTAVEPPAPAPAAEPAAVDASSLPAAPAVVRGSSAASDKGSLSEESALLEAARRALTGGDSRRALRILDEHSRKFKKPRLPTEASVLRIEALVASGDRTRAAELGKRFLARQANGPYERRVRSLIGDTAEKQR
jgi:hypothetical protein